jgi:hypothetical protein
VFENRDFENLDFENWDFENWDVENLDFENVDLGNWDFDNFDCDVLGFCICPPYLPTFTREFLLLPWQQLNFWYFLITMTFRYH